jgi:hypothetical protein
MHRKSTIEEILPRTRGYRVILRPDGLVRTGMDSWVSTNVLGARSVRVILLTDRVTNDPIND